MSNLKEASVENKMRRKEDVQWNIWEWLRDKVVPSLLITLCVGVGATYIQVIKLTEANDHTRSDLAELRNDVNNIKQTYATREEILSLTKRIEQQLEIIVLKDKLDRKRDGK